MATSVDLDLSVTNAFSPSQWKNLLSIADTFIPSLDEEEIKYVNTELSDKLLSPDHEKIDSYLKMSASESPEFVEYLKFFMAKRIPEKAQKDLGGVLDMLNGGVLTYIFTGTSTPFNELPRPEREQVLQKWKSAYLPLFRTLFDAFFSILITVFLKASPEAIAALGYEPRPKADVEKELPNSHIPVPEFENASIEHNQTITTDVVIVGSGAGGGVMAATLARAGFKVVVVEKAKYYGREHFPMRELDAHEKLFEEGTVLTSDDGVGHIITGSSWGGGTTINWSMSLQISRLARREWVEKYGLEFAESQDFQECMDTVCGRLGVSTDNIEHSLPNQIHREGARKLGWSSTPVPRNSAGKAHFCGYCGHGCRSGGKQGCAVTWLPDAQAAGARFIDQYHVDKIVIENGIAVGVTGNVNGKVLTINAKRVIVSAGTIHSPCLLIRSGIKNPNVGKNLKVHPGTATVGLFNNRDMKPWEGGTITSMVNDMNNVDGKGSGAKMFPMWCHPSFSYNRIPWENAAQWRALSLRYKTAVSFASMTRDRDSSGVVAPDPVTGKPRVISYNLAPFDCNTIIDGVIANCEILVTAGADEIYPITTPQPASYIVDKKNPQNGGGVSDPRFKEFIAKVRKDGYGPDWYGLHQMGTCRMGTSEKNSVVDVAGRVWGVPGLYVADASVFPSPPGSNPMIPTMAMSLWIANQIIAEPR